MSNFKSEYRMIPTMGMGRVNIRFDDKCKNGHDTFGMTMESQWSRDGFGGCMHEEIAQVFPEYADLVKWHLCSTDGPLHYIANTVFWAEQGRLEHARNSAIAPQATLEQLLDEEWLLARLPLLLNEFHTAMKGLPS